MDEEVRVDTVEHEGAAPEPAPQPQPAPAPAPQPLPLSVTGVAQHPPAADAGSRWIRTAMAVGLAFAIIVIAAVGSILYVFTVAPGTLRAGRSGTISALRTRVAHDYPGFTIVDAMAASEDGTADAPAREATIYFHLRNVRSPGFLYTAIYSAPAASADTTSAYEDLDDFFAWDGEPQRTTDPFIDMWLLTHPGEEVTYVTELGEAMDATRTFEVGYMRSEQRDAKVTRLDGRYRFAYVNETGVWSEIADPAVPGSASAATPELGTFRPDMSLIDTASALATFLPHFKLIEQTVYGGGDVELIVQHRSYPRTKLAIDPIWLDEGGSPDGAVRMFAGDRKRADSFARMWAKRHTTAIILSIEFDPDYEQKKNFVEVSYATSRATLDDIYASEFARFRYDPKTHTWKSAPVPDDY